MTSIKTTSSFHNPKYVECIEVCNHCANSCEYCGTLCLREVSEALLECIELWLYCADVCRFASKHMSCDSNRVKQFCDYCAKVCEDCATECDKHDMDHCKKCANVCQECSYNANKKHQNRYLETIYVKVSNLFIKYGFQKEF